jgi:hypothetical protein
MQTVIQHCKAICRTAYTTAALLEFSINGFLATIRDHDTVDQVAHGLMMISQVSGFKYWFIVAASSPTMSSIFIPVTATSADEAESNIKTAMNLILEAPREALLRDVLGTVVATLSGMLEDNHVLVSRSLT